MGILLDQVPGNLSLESLLQELGCIAKVETAEHLLALPTKALGISPSTAGYCILRYQGGNVSIYAITKLAGRV